MKVQHKEKIGEVHFQNRVWKNQISFYREELKIFQERLSEISSKNTNGDIRPSIEQFQNKFIIQLNELDTLEHKIHVSEDAAVAAGKIHIRRVDYETTEEYVDIKTGMVQFGKLYKELKDDFYRFLCKWM